MKHYKTLKALGAIFALALICLAFTNVNKASAAAKEAPPEVTGNYNKITWTYDADKDALIIKSTAEIPTSASLSLFFCTGKEVSVWDATKNRYQLDIDEVNDAKDTDGVSGQAIVLPSESFKRIKSSKDSYYIIAATSGSISASPMITINKTEWKKPTVVIDYNAAYAGNTKIAISSVTYSASKGKTIVTESVGGEELLILGGDTGKKNKKAFDTLQWSTDGNEWYNVYDVDNGFTGDKLAALVVSAGATKTKMNVYFREGGVSSKAKNATTPDESGYRPSEFAKIAIKAAAKAPKLSLDVKKAPAISIKQKFDYQVIVTGVAVTVSGQAASTATVVTPAADKWITILPFNKDGQATSPYMVTTDFKTVKMTKSASEDITKYYVNDDSVKKNLPLTKLLMWTNTTWKGDDSVTAKADVRYNKKLDYVTLDSDKHYIVLARKSAVPGKPATNYSQIEFDGMAVQPATDIKQSKGLYVNFDTASGTLYQYVIVSHDDFQYTVASGAATEIDWTSVGWKNLTSSTQIKGGVKVFNYKKFVNGTPTKSTKASTVAASGDYILIRLAGDKAHSKLPSNYSVYQITENAKKGNIGITAVSFTAVPKTLGVSLQVGSNEVASGDAIDYTVDLGAASKSNAVKFEYTVQKSNPEKVTKSSELEKVKYEYYVGTVSGDAVVKTATKTDAISVDAKTATVTATQNGYYVIAITYPYGGENLPTKYVALRVTGVMELSVVVSGSSVDIATRDAIDYKVELKPASEATITAKYFEKGDDKTSAVKFEYVSSDKTVATVTSQGAIVVAADATSASPCAITVTATQTVKVGGKDVTKTSVIKLNVKVKDPD